MCHFRSGVGVLNMSDNMLSVKFLDGEDSHTKIRSTYYIRDDDGAGATRQTPLEYKPAKDLLDLESYELTFDAGRPDWWTEEHTEQAIRQFRADITPVIAARKWDWGGYLDLGSLTSLPEGVTLSAGGYLCLRSLTSLPEGVKVKAGDVYYDGQWHGKIERF